MEENKDFENNMEYSYAENSTAAPVAVKERVLLGTVGA